MLIRKIGFVSRTYRHINRYRQILAVMIKFGFGDLIDRINRGGYLETGIQFVTRSRSKNIEKHTRAERIRMALEELGPTFVKLGQILSTRPDMLPPDMIRELEKLQDDVVQVPFHTMRDVLEGEIGGPLETLFERFDEEPLAAASIGQVYRGRLKSGDEVVVKVRRPGISAGIEVDLEILLHLASLMEEHLEEIRFFRPTKIVEEFARTLENEIDYTLEASYADRFAGQFRDNPTIHVPRVFRDLSTKEILVMEYVSGIKASNLDDLDAAGYDRTLIAQRGADLLFAQIFDYGFFHADPHPGNIFILPDNVICYLDFGMMGTVDRRSRDEMADMAFAIVRKDERKVTDALLAIVEFDEEPDRRTLESDMSHLIELYAFRPLKEIRIEQVLNRILDLILRHRLWLPFDKYLMLKALATTEGLGLMLAPDFDMTARAEPHVRRLKLQRYRPGRLAEEFFDSGGDAMKLLRELPRETREIMRQLKQGKLKASFDHRGLEPITHAMRQSANRISLGLIAASLVIGSSVMIGMETGPLFFGFSVAGLTGICLAAALGVIMVLR
ncbi:MAG: AarF/ABC1/UbiB kinase family protein [Syntrophales bacterium]|jgi:ubiquinone biosynthesis protein|nr:AarF/ABC1/UbiB kinase family protein [Syntrophales bacterium]MCK9528063.1 AarF/ABC1/UbiB kinase family protein [Syntrophales bacterium]MDX9922341.1 AarF/ABC1/UbiB kinase family protein [Syntrophales bacterium]